MSESGRESSPPHLELINGTLEEQTRLAKTLLTINEAYKETIDEKLSKLQKKLELIQIHQSELVRDIALSNNASVYLSLAKEKYCRKNIQGGVFLRDNEMLLNRIRSNYFKDRFNLEPGPNQDMLRKSRLEFYAYVPRLKAEWSLKYREKLREAVLKDARRLIQVPLTRRINFLEEKWHKMNINIDGNKKALRQINNQLKEMRIMFKEIDDYTDQEILSKINTDQIDWMKIAKMDMESLWTSNECRLVWKNVCSIEINQVKWSSVEFKCLVELARKHKESNWQKVCFELKTNRSAFLCMKRYHEKTVDKFCKRDWSNLETKELCDNADTLRIGQYIPYNYLCYLNGTRDRNSIFNWHIKVDPNLNHGKWTTIEEQAFEEALLFYNTVYNWQEISEHVMTRTAHQCKDRYELKYHNPEKYVNWTVAEDKKLLEAYKRFEGQWYKIAAFEFPNRNDNACLFRYTRLMAWQKQNSWFQAQPSEIQEFILFICKQKHKNKDEMIVFTEDGEIVPRKPIFTQKISSLVDQILANKELIIEFVEKKRRGQLSLNLLNKIGIFTPALNATIQKYQKNFNQQNLTPKNEEDTKQNTSLKLLKLELNKLHIDSTKKKQKIKQVKIDKLCKSIRTEFPNQDLTKSDKLQSFNALIRKKREQTANKEYMVKKMRSLEKRKIAGTATGCGKTLTIKQLFRTRSQSNVETCQIPKSPVFNDNLKGTELPLNLTSTAIKLNQSKKHIRNILSISKQNKEPENAEQISHLTNSGLHSPNTIVKAPGAASKRKRTSLTQTSNRSNEKKVRKEAPRCGLISEARVMSNKEEADQMKSLKLIKFEKSIKPVELSPLVRKFDEIADGEKIPCVSEQSSMFKFMYLLKKNSNNLKYFYKYTIIEYDGRLVAIKPFNMNQVTQEYLNEARLSAIRRILEQIVVK